MMRAGAGTERSGWAFSTRNMDLVLRVEGSQWSDMVRHGLARLLRLPHGGGVRRSKRDRECSEELVVQVRAELRGIRGF